MDTDQSGGTEDDVASILLQLTTIPQRSSGGGMNGENLGIDKARVFEGGGEIARGSSLKSGISLEGENVSGSGVDLNSTYKEIIEISSDEDEGEKFEKVKEKDLGVNLGGSNGGRGYSREEKGKGIADELPRPLAGKKTKFRLELDEADQLSDLKYLQEQVSVQAGQLSDLNNLQAEQDEEVVDTVSSLLVMNNQETEKVVPVDQESDSQLKAYKWKLKCQTAEWEVQQDIIEMRRRQEEADERRLQEEADERRLQEEANERRLQEEANERRRQWEEANEQRRQWEEERQRRRRMGVAKHYAHFDPDKDEVYGDYYSYYGEKEKEVRKPSDEAKPKLEQFSGPFASALKAIKDQNDKEKPENLIKWNAHNSNFRPLIVPSLLDLSLDGLAKNANEIASLDHIPEWLRRRLTNRLCDSRKMDIHVLELLLKDSPTEIRVKDCSWIKEIQLSKILAKADLQNLRVLQLDLCGRLTTVDLLAPFLNKLPCLMILSLRGGGHLSDVTLKPIVAAAPFLQSINLSQSALLSCFGIGTLAKSLKTTLRELYIDDCPKIEAMSTLLSLKKFDHLQVLSLAGNETVSDGFVRGIAAACGGSLREFNLAECLNLTDESLEAIGHHCPELCSLNISNLHKLTDFGMQYLANGCRSLRSLNLTRNKFSDEAIAAFLETSGQSLEELSLSNVREVGVNTALSLAKCSRGLKCLDLSWCRKLSNQALGLIVDSCLSLKLLKLFGCTQIAGEFVNGHSNSQLHIVGLNLTPLLKHVNIFEPVDVLLRYPPPETN